MNPVELTDEQRHVCRSILDGVRAGKPVQTLGGYAGTGKTTVAAHLNRELLGFAVCAFTGKAADILRRKGMSAETIHSTIYVPEKDPDREDGVKFRLRFNWELPYRGFLVDEASMVAAGLFDDLQSFGKPIIAIGDHGQLPPVGDDAGLMASPDYRLETIHRNAGPIARFAEHLRKGGEAADWPNPSGPGVWVVGKRQMTEDRLTAADQVICAFNSTRVNVNRQIRNKLGRRSPYPEPGDRVICLRNCRELAVFNGQQGTAKEIDQSHGDIMFAPTYGYPVWVNADPAGWNSPKTPPRPRGARPGESIPFDFAYCVTAHKCVHPDTLVETPSGVMAISDTADSGLIATPDGVREYRNKVINQESAALCLVTEYGYEITVTPEHKAETWLGDGYGMTTADRMTAGAWVRLKRGETCKPALSAMPEMPDGDVRARRIISPKMAEKLAEFFGLMVADGTVFRGGFRLAKRHEDVLKRFESSASDLFGCKPRRVNASGTSAVEVSSTILVEWLRLVGGMNPNAKEVPACVLRSPSSIHCAFLRGVFEDGTVNVKSGRSDHIEWCCHSPKLLRQVRYMLLRQGIVTASGDRRLYVYGANAVKFANRIGFISAFKVNRLGGFRDVERYSVFPVSNEELGRLKSKLSRRDFQNAKSRGYLSRTKAAGVGLDFVRDRMGYHHDRITRIEKVRCPSVCVEVPDGHRFLQNGFPWGNSQGDEWNKVLVIEERCDLWEHSRWAYTAASRAREALVWVADRGPRR